MPKTSLQRQWVVGSTWDWYWFAARDSSLNVGPPIHSG